MILVKLKVNTKPKERIAMVTQERADQLIKTHPNTYSLLEENKTVVFEPLEEITEQNISKEKVSKPKETK